MKTSMKKLLVNVLDTISNYKSKWDAVYNWLNAGNNSQILVRSDWLPSGESYGVAMRCRGTSYPGFGAADSYYICVTSTGNFYIGRQLNRATSITWTRIS